MNLRELALKLAAITVIADAADEAKEALRAEFAEKLNEVGADATKALWEDEEIAKVSMVSPKEKPWVTNEKAFLAYMKENHPEAIIETVDKVHREAFLDSIKNFDGKAADGNTGEMLNFIGFKKANPYISTRFAEGGRDIIKGALTDGSINATMLLSNAQLAIENE